MQAAFKIFNLLYPKQEVNLSLSLDELKTLCNTISIRIANYGCQAGKSIYIS